MAQSAPLIIRLLASSVTAASRAGKIVRDVMSKGELGIVEKVSKTVSDHVRTLHKRFYWFSDVKIVNM